MCLFINLFNLEAAHVSVIIFFVAHSLETPLIRTNVFGNDPYGMSISLNLYVNESTLPFGFICLTDSETMGECCTSPMISPPTHANIPLDAVLISQCKGAVES